MNLAKIRKKAHHINPVSPPTGTTEISGTQDVCNDSSPMIVEETPGVAIKAIVNVIPEPSDSRPPAVSVTRAVRQDPVQRILAGREAAGCHQEQLAGQQQISKEYDEYLCFRLADEIYGVSIMQLKEIIKPREVTEMPRAPEFISGIISLRGVIIPILDMLIRLGLKRTALTGKERIVVVKHGDSFSGLLVDEVLNVARITKDNLEAVPAVLEGIDRDFVRGIGRSENRMIILLNLENIANIDLF